MNQATKPTADQRPSALSLSYEHQRANMIADTIKTARNFAEFYRKFDTYLADNEMHDDQSREAVAFFLELDDELAVIEAKVRQRAQAVEEE